MEKSTIVESVYAFLEGRCTLKRIGGGSETDVYQTDDARYVIKIKGDLTNTVETALSQACKLRDTATRFTTYLGVEHSVPTYFLLARDQSGSINTVAIQPYLADASSLSAIDYCALTPRVWAQIDRQLLTILRRSLRCYKYTGQMPDLYGTFSRTKVERRRMNTFLKWPERVWHFFTQRLWQAHNLMLTHEANPRVVLVDYDHVRWSGLWGKLYYTTCWLLFWRELIFLAGSEASSLIEDEFIDTLFKHCTIYRRQKHWKLCNV